MIPSSGPLARRLLVSRTMRTVCPALALLALLAAPSRPARAAGVAAASASEGGAAIPATLTLEAALGLFRTRGFDLLLADAQVAAAAGDLLAAGASQNPQLSAGLTHSPGYDASKCAGCSATGFNLGVSDQGALSDLLLTRKRGLRQDVARAALEAAKLSRADAQRTLELSLKTLFTQALLAGAQIDLAGEARESAARTRALNEKRFALGAVSEADVARAEVAELEAEQAREGATQQLASLRAGLGVFLGLRGAAAPPAFELDPKGLDFRVPAALAEASAGSLLQAALEARPDLRATALQRERAAASIALVQRQRWPDLALNLGYAQQGTSQDAIAPPTVSVGFSLPLPILYQQGGELARAEADLSAQAALRQKQEAQVVADVRAAFAAFSAARAQVERMDARLLGRARRARDLIEVQYQKGSASLLDLLDAQRTFLAVNGERLALLAGYWNAVASLEAAVSKELR